MIQLDDNQTSNKDKFTDNDIVCRLGGFVRELRLTGSKVFDRLKTTSPAPEPAEKVCLASTGIILGEMNSL
jgi:hypothetical protein